METNTTNKLAIECLKDMVISTKLWYAVKDVAESVLYKHYVPRADCMGLAAITIDKALRAWKQDKDFALLVWSYAGAESQKYHRDMSVIKQPSTTKVKCDKAKGIETQKIGVVYPSDYEIAGEDGEANMDHMYGSIEPEVYEDSTIDKVISQLTDDERFLLNAMLGSELGNGTTAKLGKHFGVSRQIINARFVKLKKKMLKLKQLCDFDENKSTL